MSRSFVRFFTNRILLTIVAVAMSWFCLTAILAESAEARTQQEINYDYYTDASHTTVCGSKVIACNGRTYVNGTITAYYTVMYIPCD